MAVDVDKARHRHQAGAVDRDVGRTGIARPDMDELVAGKDEIAVLEIDVPLIGFVPGDDKIEPRNAGYFCGHRFFPSPGRLA